MSLLKLPYSAKVHFHGGKVWQFDKSPAIHHTDTFSSAIHGQTDSSWMDTNDHSLEHQQSDGWTNP